MESFVKLLSEFYENSDINFKLYNNVFMDEYEHYNKKGRYVACIVNSIIYLCKINNIGCTDINITHIKDLFTIMLQIETLVDYFNDDETIMTLDGIKEMDDGDGGEVSPMCGGFYLINDFIDCSINIYEFFEQIAVNNINLHIRRKINGKMEYLDEIREPSIHHDIFDTLMLLYNCLNPSNDIKIALK